MHLSYVEFLKNLIYHTCKHLALPVPLFPFSFFGMCIRNYFCLLILTRQLAMGIKDSLTFFGSSAIVVLSDLTNRYRVFSQSQDK